VHYVNSTFIISRDTASDIALWGGGPSGEDLTLVALDPDLINFYDISCVSAPLGDHLRRIRLEAKDYGQTTLQARIGPVGATWANAAIAVEGSVIAQGEMFRAHDAPVGYNVKTQAVDFHWNQKGTFNEFGIADHSPARAAGEFVFKGAKYFRYGGRVLLVAAVAIDVYSIVVSSNPLRRSTQVVAGWVGAWAGCKAVGAGRSVRGHSGGAKG
jgi:hypothetical protein